MVFIDLENEYDSFPVETIWRVLSVRKIQGSYVRVIYDMYCWSTINIHNVYRYTNSFPFEFKLH